VSSERPYFQILLRFSSNPSNLVGKVFLCGRSWPDFKGLFLEKRPWKSFSIKCSNSGINDSTPHTQNNVIWISSKTELEISFLNSLLEKWVWESGPKIDPATGVMRQAWEVWITESLVSPKSTSNQSSKLSTVLQYPSRKAHTYTCMHMCIHIYICVRVCVSVYTHTQAHIYGYMQTPELSHLFIHTDISQSTRMHFYVYLHCIYTHVYMFIYTHT